MEPDNSLIDQKIVSIKIRKPSDQVTWLAALDMAAEPIIIMQRENQRIGYCSATQQAIPNFYFDRQPGKTLRSYPDNPTG
jgi:hypothetical protein